MSTNGIVFYILSVLLLRMNGDIPQKIDFLVNYTQE